jgi:cell division protein FtsW
MGVRADARVVAVLPERRLLLRLWLTRLLWLFGILLVWGCMAVFSTTVYQRIALDRSPYDKFLRHLMFIAIAGGASVALLLAGRLMQPLRRWAVRLIPILYAVSLVLVAMVTLTSFGESYGGATLTLRFGSFGFQPSEMMKITTVLYLAMLLCWWRDISQLDTAARSVKSQGFRRWVACLFKRRDSRPVWPDLPRRAVVVLLLPVFFTLMQKDMGNASLILGMGIITILLAGVDWRQLSASALLMIVLGCVGVLLKPEYVDHAHSRLRVYLALLENKQVDQDGEGFQITQARGALALGGLTGRGYLNSEQKMNRLPVASEDFVYPIVVEEFGFVGGVLVILLFLGLAWCSINLANACIDPFNRCVIGALGIGLCMQAYVNIGTTIGTVPVTGITLPFFSEGGTSIVVSTLAIATIAVLALSEIRASGAGNARQDAGHAC